MRTRADAARGRVWLDVEDTGPGISAEIRDRIFEPFFTTKPVGQGTGLGLSLCHGIVEGHGGTLCLVSEPGHGAIFRVELPVVAPPTTSGKRAPGAPPVVKGMRILVVDDERLVLQLLGEMLGADHHTVDTVADGTQALEQLRRSSYDLILSDVRMPYLDGPGLYRALERRLPDLCRRFVLMTGDVLSAEIQTFLEQTGVPGLSKPFDRGEVRRVIQLVASGGRWRPAGRGAQLDQERVVQPPNRRRVVWRVSAIGCGNREPNCLLNSLSSSSACRHSPGSQRSASWS